MTALQHRIREIKPALILFYLSSLGFLCVFSVQRYLGLPFDPLAGACFMAFVFGIYTFNRFTDTAEDFTNDIGKLLFFQRRKAFLWLALGAMAAGVVALVWLRKLNWLHVLLLATGFGYSYRLIPWWSPARGFRLIRIKEMTFVKNLAVSFLWSASVFLIPMLFSAVPRAASGGVLLLAAALFLSTLNNTVFDDILDEPGDKVAGIKTLPTMWGRRRSYLLLWSLNAAWLAAIAGLLLGGGLDMAHAAFLAFFAIYPIVYMGLDALGGRWRAPVDFLAESDLLFFSAGLLLLGR